MSAAKNSIKAALRFLRKPRLWGMAMQAVWLSGWYRWHLLKKPFSELSSKIGEYRYETPDEPISLEVLKVCADVRYVVMGICKRTPWESLCMVQALTAKKILNRKGIPCTLYMGVRNGEKGEMVAHAWLRCSDKIVTGENGYWTYTVTGTYGDK